MMKIAHVLRRLVFGEWGGTEQVVWNLSKAQRAAGHEVRLFATDALCKTPREVREGLEIVRFPCVYPWWPMGRKLKAKLDKKGGNPFVPGLGRAVREWGAEVVHCHAMGRMAELCIRTAEAAGSKCVVSLHGGASNVPEAEARELRAPTRGRVPWGKAVETALGWKRRVPEGADGIVCVGEDEYEFWRGRHPHVLWLPNGVDTNVFSGGIPVFRNFGIPGRGGDLFKVLCVARIDRQKGQMALVEALGRREKLAVRLVGPVTQPDYLEEMQARAKELGAEGRLEVVGALPPGSAELVGEYKRADAFVLPSRHEPFGIAVLEAWASGLPVIASHVGGMGALCDAHPGAALTFEPDQPGALDAALDRLLRTPSLRRDMGMAGPKAAQDYDWRRLSAKLIAFYRELWHK